MIKTRIVWQDPKPVEFADEFYQKIQEFVAQGKTDGNLAKSQSNESGYNISTRTWTDTASAQEWLDFSATFGPVSAEIIEE